MSLNITTKYSPTNTVYTIIGTGDKAKVIESSVQSIDITATVRETLVIYNCRVSRKAIGCEVPGMPDNYTVPRTEKTMYDTLEDCLNSMVVK